MRLIAFVFTVCVLGLGNPAIAQNWQDYSYPEYSLRIAFPAEPQIETATYTVADGRSVPAHVYLVRHDSGVLKLTIAELGDSGLDESAVIEHAIKMLSEGGEVKVNIPHRINRVYGRQLSILGADGSRSTVALFDHNGRLYQIEGKSLPIGDDATGDAIRFAQSLVFTGGGSNRSPEQIQAGRATCLARAADTGTTNADPDGRRRAERRCRFTPL